MSETIVVGGQYLMGAISSDLWVVASHPTGLPLVVNTRTGSSMVLTDADITGGNLLIQAIGSPVSPLYAVGQLVKVKNSILSFRIIAVTSTAAGTSSDGNMYIGSLINSAVPVSDSSSAGPTTFTLAGFLETSIGPVIG